jgi:hypothetical protein
VEVAEAALADAYRASGSKQRLIGEFSYAAKSWPHERRVITRLEYGEQGTNPRFVIAILGIGAGLALPSYQDRDIRAQVAEGLALADMAKQAIAAEQARSGKLPADNAAAGLPPADRIVGNYVS